MHQRQVAARRGQPAVSRLGLGAQQPVLQAQSRRLVRLCQAGHQLFRRRFQETGCELMQQASDLVGRLIEQGQLVRQHLAQWLAMSQHMLQLPGQLRQIGVPHGAGVARQRVGQSHHVVTDRPVRLQGPFAQGGAQAPRLFVRLIEVDVEQGNADAQRPDDLDLFIIGGQGDLFRGSSG